MMNDVKPVRQARYPVPKHVFIPKAATQNLKNLKNLKFSWILAFFKKSPYVTF